ncbi:MAG: indole-3-glycerol phosphate synthase TrpC [Candidatus Eremiobacteraeota bacterium]|nr:indole-3-glycerol phosphate synthase TrpC [Candidatus Eremiobacteraeota bacterium]
MSDILTRIFERKAQAMAREQAAESFEVIRERAAARSHDRRGFAEALHAATGPAIIGEIKRASPSAGLIARNFDPAQTAAVYDAAGVDCISVITESDHFLGELGFLEVARARTRTPILRKDFLSTPYQIAQSAAYGADAVLLIAAALRDDQIRACMQEARRFGLAVLLEVHDETELERALALEATLVGINNRNLRTFETDLAVSEFLLPYVPSGVTVVSESGMREPDDILRLHRAGARGFLIGESLMRSDDPARLIQTLKNALGVFH